MISKVLSTQRMKVFIPDDSLVWASATIVEETQPGEYILEIDDPDFAPTPSSPRVITKSIPKVESIPLQNTNVPATGVHDMCLLNYLHEGSILDNLRRRFRFEFPYTYTGNICIAVNPYKWLDIYSDNMRNAHVNRMRHELEPHVYATSAAAYKGIRDFARNQSVLVSGESGAGKTETVKILMGHLAHISGYTANDKEIIGKVLQANPLLESFGNAKTLRNDNSSRFGKFIQLCFDELGVLQGSRCVTYLLEKSRVISQNDNERNFHVFHQLFAAPEDLKSSLRLPCQSTAEDFRYTCEGDIHTRVIEGVADGERFVMTMEALQLLGVTSGERQRMLRILAGVLHLGQINFVPGEDSEHSEIDPASLPTATVCCELLGLELAALRKNFTTRSLEVAGEKDLMVGLSRDQASDSRDALAKDIYDRLFQWLVASINATTCAPKHCTRTVSLLDIFGFESFKINRFEQLCINYANEKLQQKFTQDVFKAVQDEYRSEGLAWELIGFQDNSEVLELLEGRMGVLDLLNEECLMPQGTDMKYLAKLTTHCKRHPNFSMSVYTSKQEFCVQHYAGKVAYDVSRFVERNRDTLPFEMKTLMLSSENDLVIRIFSEDITGNGNGGEVSVPMSNRRKSTHGAHHGNGGGGGGAKRSSFVKADTVTMKFKSQLNKLMELISTTDVQYVRCIKPNSIKCSKTFDRQMVTEQLRCAGMIEAIRISRAAYPYRLSLEDFMERFGRLKSSACRTAGAQQQHVLSPTKQCQMILKALLPTLDLAKEKSYEVGRSKIYFSSGVLEALEAVREKRILKLIVTVQSIFRGLTGRRSYLLMRFGTIKLQSGFRARRQRMAFLICKHAAVVLQCVARAIVAKRVVSERRCLTACVKLQSWMRMQPIRVRFNCVRASSVKLGAWVKMTLQRKRYILALHEARENAKLSNQLEELKLKLQEESAMREQMAREQAVTAEQLKQQLREEMRKEMLAEMGETDLKTSLQSAVGQPMVPLMELQDEPGLAIPAESSSLSLFSPTSTHPVRSASNNVSLIESLQAELTKLRGRVDQLESENSHLKQKIRRGSTFMTQKDGEIAHSRASHDNLKKELENLRAENKRLLKQSTQYRGEKAQVLDAVFQLTNDIEDLRRVKEHVQDIESDYRQQMVAQQQFVFATLKGLEASEDIVQALQDAFDTASVHSQEGPGLLFEPATPSKPNAKTNKRLSYTPSAFAWQPDENSCPMYANANASGFKGRQSFLSPVRNSNQRGVSNALLMSSSSMKAVGKLEGEALLDKLLSSAEKEKKSRSALQERK